MPYDKRKLKRVDIFLIVESKSLKRAAAHSVGITGNLSCEGFSLESQSFDFGLGEILEFRLKHSQIDLSVTVLGEIVWKKQGWYKYAAGVKFRDVNEETKSKILELISVVSTMPDEPVPAPEDSEGKPENEKDEKPEGRDVVGRTDELVPDTVQPNLDDIAAAEKDRKKKSRLYVPIVMIITIIFMLALPAALKKINKGFESFTESIFSQDIDRKEPVFAAGDAQTGGQTFKEPFKQLQEQIEEIMKPEPDVKKETILKAAPTVKAEKVLGNKVIKKIAKPKKIKRAAGAQKTAKAKVRVKSKKVVKIETAVKTKKSFKARTVVKSEETIKAKADAKSKKPPKTRPAEKRNQTRKPESVVKAETPPPAGLTAKLEEPIKTIPAEKAEEREKPAKTGSVVKLPKFPEIALVVRRKKPQKIQDSSVTGKNEIANTGLSEKWEKIGSTKNGTPLFIDTETISYPSEDIVKFSMKASINKKEFIALLEIACSRNKLRIIRKPLEKPPVLSPYSTEWRDIIPESRLLYEAVCSKRNRS